jgi:hypothetical protein
MQVQAVNNIYRGIAAYSNPESEMRLRMHIGKHLARCSCEERVDVIEAYVKKFGRESVRAVVGEEGA